MDPVTLNNEVVLARSLIKRTKAFVNQKLCRKLAMLRGRSNGPSVSKYKRKGDLLVEEIQTIKKLKPDRIFKFAVQNDISFANIVKQVKYSMDERALARLAEYPLLKKKVLDFKEKYSNWKSVADKCWDENRPKKLSRIKKENTKKSLKNSVLNNEQSIPKSVDKKKKKSLGDVKVNETIDGVVDSSKQSKNDIMSSHQDINVNKEENIHNMKKDNVENSDQDESYKDFEDVDSEESNHDMEELILKNIKCTKLTSKNKTLPKNRNKPSISRIKDPPRVNTEMAVMKIDVSKLTDEIVLTEDLIIKRNTDSESEEEKPKSSFFLSMNENRQVIPTLESIKKPKKAPLFVDEKGRALNRKERRALMRGEQILPAKKISKPDHLKIDLKSPNLIKIKHPVANQWVPKQEKELDSCASQPSDILHPSWEAKRLQKKQVISLNVFKGKKTHFDD